MSLCLPGSVMVYERKILRVNIDKKNEVVYPFKIMICPESYTSNFDTPISRFYVS